MLSSIFRIGFYNESALFSILKGVLLFVKCSLVFCEGNIQNANDRASIEIPVYHKTNFNINLISVGLWFTNREHYWLVYIHVLMFIYPRVHIHQILWDLNIPFHTPKIGLEQFFLQIFCSSSRYFVYEHMFLIKD